VHVSVKMHSLFKHLEPWGQTVDEHDEVPWQVPPTHGRSLGQITPTAPQFWGSVARERHPASVQVPKPPSEPSHGVPGGSPITQVLATQLPRTNENPEGQPKPPSAVPLPDVPELPELPEVAEPGAPVEPAEVDPLELDVETLDVETDALEVDGPDADADAADAERPPTAPEPPLAPEARDEVEATVEPAEAEERTAEAPVAAVAPALELPWLEALKQPDTMKRRVTP
jgi:hypothetical protein